LARRAPRIEHNDEGRAREWIARALNAAPDPAWTADGHVSDRWLPVSPSGKLDAFEWRVPVTGVPSAAPAIEREPAPVAAVTAAPAVTASEPISQNAPAASQKPVEQKLEVSPAAAKSADGALALRRVAPPQPKPEAVIPLVHAPDDPGPDAADENERSAEPQNGGWRKIFE
jgi:HemY protein